MSYRPELDHRRSLRLGGYDYSQSGAYFVTLCTHNKRHLFGEVVEDEVVLNRAGVAAKKCWLEIPTHFRDVELDLFIVMPNHVHGIVFLHGASEGANDYSPLHVDEGPRGTSRTIGSVVRGFKIGVTKWFRDNSGPIEPVWQRNYYERVIRNEAELAALRDYITHNAIRRGD